MHIIYSTRPCQETVIYLHYNQLGLSKQQKMQSMNPLFCNQTSQPLQNPPTLPHSLPTATQIVSHLTALEAGPSNLVSPKRKFQIFTDSQLRHLSINSEDEPTVVYKPRKYTEGFVDFHPDSLKKSRRQFHQQKNIASSHSLNDKDEAKTYRKHKIFDHNQTKLNPHDSQMQLMTNTGSQQSLLPTRRLRQSLDAALRNSKVHYELHEPEINTRVTLSPIKSSKAIQRNVSLEPASSQKIISVNYPPPKPFPGTPSHSHAIPHTPQKITFTYQENVIKPFLASQVSVTPPPHPTTITQQERAYRKVSTQLFRQAQPMTNSFENMYRSTCNRQDLNTLAQQKTKKSIFNTKTAQKRYQIDQRPVVSWGNRIRTELMGTNREDLQQQVRKEQQSKTALVNCKESMIVGKKMDRNKLKLEDSFSNVSDNQSSKRYYDQDFEFVPQVKKISYNNIDVSRDESFGDEESQFKPAELFMDFKLNRTNEEPEPPKIIKQKLFQEAKEKGTMKSDMILGHLVHEITIERPSKPWIEPKKLLPAALILMAIMLLLIQLAI